MGDHLSEIDAEKREDRGTCPGGQGEGEDSRQCRNCPPVPAKNAWPWHVHV